MRSKFLHFYLCYFSNVMATNFWSIVLTRSSISRHLKFITKRVVSIFNNLAFLEQFWLQIGNNMPLKMPGNLAVCDFDIIYCEQKKEQKKLWQIQCKRFQISFWKKPSQFMYVRYCCHSWGLQVRQKFHKKSNHGDFLHINEQVVTLLLFVMFVSVDIEKSWHLLSPGCALAQPCCKNQKVLSYDV